MTMSKNSEYWGRRLQEITINRYDATILETEKKLKRLYQSAMKKMQIETENTYIKLLETGKITRSELYQNSRFLELQDQFEIELAKLGTKEEKILSSLFAEEYETVFGMTREEMGEYKPQCIYNPLLANTIINQSWSGDNYSGRIWNNKNKLCTLLKDKTVEAILLGKSIDNVTKVVMDRLEAGYSDAERLVRSELMHTLNAAQQEVYKEAGYKELEILVYFDERTCDTCAKLDGTKLPIDSKDIPPIHARCRCTVIPVIEGVKGTTRLAEDPITGEKYKVPADMTYNEWWGKNVVAKYGQETVDTHMKMIRNEWSDRKQYEKYLSILGKESPKTFEDFQSLKYNEVNKWKDLKSDFRYQNMLNNRKLVEMDKNTRSLKTDGVKNSIADLIDNEGNVKQRRIYDEYGKVIKDIDTSNHSKPKYHPMGAHKHVYDYNKQLPHGAADYFTEEELRQNRDIIKEGVNYNDDRNK